MKKIIVSNCFPCVMKNLCAQSLLCKIQNKFLYTANLELIFVDIKDGLGKK